MTESEICYLLPRTGFSPEKWIEKARRGGMTFAIDEDDNLLRWEAVEETDPGPGLTRKALCNEFERYRWFIEPELRGRIWSEGRSVSVGDFQDPCRQYVFQVLAGTPCIEG